MSASEFLFISNIPNKMSPLTLMPDVKNPYAKMAYFDSPDFKSSRQAFVFYPESNDSKWKSLLERLNSKDSIEAKYVYYPSGNTPYITHVPPGTEVLPYVYVENLPKDVEFHHIVSGLPHIVNLRFMDVTYKEDKWAFIYLGQNVDPNLRRSVVMGLRSKVINGYSVYATELLATSACEFAASSKPQVDSLNRKSKVADETPCISAAFRSEFLYIYDVPQPLGHGKILHFIKSSGIKLARIFFVETTKHLKHGFLHMPGLSDDQWKEAKEMIQNHYFHAAGLPHNCGVRISVAETWLQPQGASPPPNNKSGGKFEIMDYYFIYNVPRGVGEQLLVHGIVQNKIRIQLFDPTPPDSGQARIGFAVRLETAADRSSVEEILGVIRKRRFGDSGIYVDRIWKFREDGVDASTAPVSIQLSGTGNGSDKGDDHSKVQIVTRLVSPVNGLTKSNLLFLHGIPAEMEDSNLYEGVPVAKCACFSTTDNKRCCFVQPTYPDRYSWSCALSTFYQRFANGKLGAEINEVFKVDGEIKTTPHGIVRSCFLQVSNLPGDLTEEQLSEDVPHLTDISFLLPVTTDGSAIVLLSTTCEEEIREAISAIRAKTIKGRRPQVGRLYLSSVENPPIWPSYRAPCQTFAEDDELMDGEYLCSADPVDGYQDKPEDDELMDGDPVELQETCVEDENDMVDDHRCSDDTAGDVSTKEVNETVDARAELKNAYVTIVEGLPILINDKSIISILHSSKNVRWQDAFCVISSPTGQNNRLLMYSSSHEEAQSLVSSVLPLLKKNFRHRTLLTHIRPAREKDEIIPIPEEVAFRLGCSHILLYNLPRQSAPTIRSKLREIVGMPSLNIDLKYAEKKFIGHGIIAARDWQACSILFSALNGTKFGTNCEVKAKYIAK